VYSNFLCEENSLKSAPCGDGVKHSFNNYQEKERANNWNRQQELSKAFFMFMIIEKLPSYQFKNPLKLPRLLFLFES
jgi:hypothetical protein